MSRTQRVLIAVAITLVGCFGVLGKDVMYAILGTIIILLIVFGFIALWVWAIEGTLPNIFAGEKAK